MKSNEHDICLQGVVKFTFSDETLLQFFKLWLLIFLFFVATNGGTPVSPALAPALRVGLGRGWQECIVSGIFLSVFTKAQKPMRCCISF